MALWAGRKQTQSKLGTILTSSPILAKIKSESLSRSVLAMYEFVLWFGTNIEMSRAI